MSAIRDASNVLRTLSTISVRDAGNVLRSCSVALRDNASVLRQSAGALAVTADSYLEGSAYSPSGAYAYTDASTAFATGGRSPYSYFWTPSAGWSALNPGAATCSFRSPLLNPGDVEAGTASVTVTDANGDTATFTPVDLYAYNSYL